ncbi:MAG TPA: glycosyltransferase family 39 protein [Xanthobacteraceae bacterium]|jgi:4-amino-4-deoxy-L-arabinose transferase-like glycosyltransferase|nr:glycosyltransferase family 39 protein [Xanthobacteraceae bacterium]
MTVVIDETAKRLSFGPDHKALADFASASNGRATAWLVLVCLLTFLPGFFTLPPVDRDEARFAQASKQMLETGDYVDIRFQDESRYKKPIGIYWLQAGVVRLGEAVGVPRAHARIWLYRLPSLFGAIGAVLATYWAALAFVSRRAALIAGLMLASCLLLGFEARLATTDAMLLFTIVVAMGALGRAYLGAHGVAHAMAHPWRLPAIFWTAVAAGVLLKGPLILMFAGLAAVALIAVDRSAAWLMRLKPALGVLWMLLLVLPWFIAIAAKTGDSFFAESLGHDLFAKVGSGQESHGAPPGTYLVLFWLTFFPGAVLAGPAAPAVWRARAEPGARFLLAWILPAWIVLEIVATKLPHYVLPLYPAIAILIAGVVDNHALSHGRWMKTAPMWWFILSVALAIAAVSLHIAVGQQAGVLAWPFLVAGVLVALFAWWLYGVDGPESSLLRAVTAAILLSWGLFGQTLSAIPRLFPANDLEKYVRFTAGCDDPQVATTGYHEPSLVFLTGTELRHTTGAGAAEFLKPGGCRFAFVEAHQERSFAQRAEALGVRYAKGMRVDGINVSGGRAITVTVYRAEAGP